VCNNPNCIVVQNFGGVVETSCWPAAWCCSECQVIEIENENKNKNKKKGGEKNEKA